MTALHVLFSIFTIGPLVHAATTAARGVRTGDDTATASSARLLKIYSYASVGVVIFGFALMSADSKYRPGQKVAEFSETWLWVSTLLWVVAIGLVLAVLVPTLQRATHRIGAQQSVVALTGRVAALGGLVAVIFAVVVFLMVYRPGS